MKFLEHNSKTNRTDQERDIQSYKWEQNIKKKNLYQLRDGLKIRFTNIMKYYFVIIKDNHKEN